MSRATKLSNHRKAIAWLCDRYPLTAEEIEENTRRRKAFRLAQMHRRRARKRSLERNPSAKSREMPPVAYSGEGELHVLMREAGLSSVEFCELAGIRLSTFHRYDGHPLAKWPVQLLRFYIRQKRMSEFLASRGWDPTQWHEKGLPASPDGRYPRTAEQVKAIQREVDATINPEED